MRPQLVHAAGRPVPARRIDIFIRDKEGYPVPSAEVQFFVNGKPVESPENVQGHVRFQLKDGEAAVTVAVSYGGQTQNAELAQGQDSFTFTFDVNILFYVVDKHIALIASFILFGSGRFMSFVFNNPTPLQSHLLMGIFSLAVGAMIVEVAGLFRVGISVWEKLAMGGLSALIVFGILTEITPF